ncbi:MAG: hypothetical protein KAT43_03325 [Nanoarchaeota archaeon]|nr:hypothetical protein [Nanoarchaeota archaeon]
MNNFFSGHNMANDIMGQTSLPMQMRDYQNDFLVGRDRCVEHHPERLNVGYETTKPFLPVPEPVFIAERPVHYIPNPEPVFIAERPVHYIPNPEPVFIAERPVFHVPEPVPSLYVSPRFKFRIVDGVVIFED